MLSTIEESRLRLSKNTAAKKKSQLGQFLTPARTAQYMASLFYPATGSVCRLLDPGAGIGSLSSAFLERCISGDLAFDKAEITAFELDPLLHKELESTFSGHSKRIPLAYEIMGDDFIEAAVNRIQFGNDRGFSHAILNPPYKKINSNSRHRFLLRQAGIETVNLYSAFVALTLTLMAPGGQLVAIIPRSFCNGPYYRPFRNFLLGRATIRHMHLFESRNKAFQDDDVLQENIIIMLERGGQQGDVRVTTSTDDSFSDLATHVHHFDRIVSPTDPEHFIHIPRAPCGSITELSTTIRYSLEDIGVQVSTGPVVDFRLKEHLRSMPGPGTVPLLYPCHFNGQHTEWPKVDAKKPNAIHRNMETEKWLFPTGFYCVVRRFSSKEEKRRIMASVVQPDTFAGAEALGFENHLNVFHDGKHGLPAALSPGSHSTLIRTLIEDFGPCFVPGGELVYVGGTGTKWGYLDQELLASLGVKIGRHGKMPDVVIYHRKKNWLILAEAVTSSGPVDGGRHMELAKVFKGSKAGLVYVTAFPDRGEIFRRFLTVVAWETEVWCASDPTHLIHFNGIRFLGPYNK